VGLLVTAAGIFSTAVILAAALRKLRLPPLLGMICGGALVGHLLPEPLLPAWPYGHWQLGHVAAEVRQAILAVILLRAGLSLSRAELRRAGTLALRLGILPLCGDALLLSVAAHLLLAMPVAPAIVLGFTVAAISPAIVIPGVLELLGKRQGAQRHVPAALLAGAPLDNIVCLLALGLALSFATGEAGGADVLLQLPFSVAISLLLGYIVGCLFAKLCRLVRRPRRRMLALWTAALLLIALGRLLDVSYVLAIITLGAVVRARRPDAAATVNEELQRVWQVAQYALFGLIGAALDLAPLARAGLLLAFAVGLGQLGRAAGSWLATSRQGLHPRERLACVLCYVPKATIQAAFGSLALDQGLAEGHLVLAGAVLAIVICAPLGMVALHEGADRLLPCTRRA